ncbi:MAG: hypothetical protein ACD_46C00147G0004, partial [uncultured bacterium]
MEMLSKILTLLIGMMLVGVTQVNAGMPNEINTKAFNKNNSVLPKGARVLAGDVSKNEFYILDKTEKDPIKQDADIKPIKVAATSTKSPVKLAWHAKLSQHKLALKKSHTKLQVALKNKQISKTKLQVALKNKQTSKTK